MRGARCLGKSVAPLERTVQSYRREEPQQYPQLGFHRPFRRSQELKA